MSKGILQSALDKFFPKEKPPAVTITQSSSGCLIITVCGRFSYKDLEKIQDAARFMLKPGCKLNCLILAEEFDGWEKEGNWDDLNFLHAADEQINRIAVVTEEKWKDRMLMFLGAGHRKAAVRHFFPEDKDKAALWVAGRSR